MPVEAGAIIPNQKNPDSVLIERAVRGYEQAMQHKLDAVVESSIYNAMVLAVEAPEANLDVIEYRLKELSVVHSSRSIRMKAFLALEFLTDHEFRQNFTNALVSQPEAKDKANLFRNLSEQLIAKSIKVD